MNAALATIVHGEGDAFKKILAVSTAVLIHDTQGECVITTWKIADGATVNPGDAIATIETAQAILDVEAEDAGRIELVAKLQQGLKEGDVFARIHAG